MWNPQRGRWESELPSFPFPLSLVGKMLGRRTGVTALPLQLASLSFSLDKEERANQREIKVHVPQRTSRREGRKGSSWEREAEAERKPHGLNKSLNQPIPRIRQWRHMTGSAQAMWGCPPVQPRRRGNEGR